MLSLVDSAGRVRRSELTMSDVEALAAACAGGHVDKVEALLAKGMCETVDFFTLRDRPHQFPRLARRIHEEPHF